MYKLFVYIVSIICKIFKNVEKSWDLLDLLIYTNVCGVGIDYNKEHFYKLFTVLMPTFGPGQREFYQMCYRIRKFYEDDILVLNNLIIQ